jgi:hypothetical protein
LLISSGSILLFPDIPQIISYSFWIANLIAVIIE